MLTSEMRRQSPLPGAPNVGEILLEENLPKILVRTQGALLHDLGDDYGGGDEINKDKHTLQEICYLVTLHIGH